MNISILTTDDSQLWQNIFLRMPLLHRQPFMQPEWYRLFENNGYGKAMCYIAEQEGNIALYPFLINSVNEAGYSLPGDYFDIQGAPGYNGIASNTEDEAFLNAFNSSFVTWCTSNNIVAEFSRCNPVDNNHKFFPNEAISEANRNIIADLWAIGGANSNYDRSALKNIRKAEREGLTIQITPGNKVCKEHLDSITAIYNGTMERNNAGKEYFHSRDFFADVSQVLGDSSLFCFTLYKGEAIAAEIVVKGITSAYSWLGGTCENFYPLRPNDILKDRIISYLQHAGLRYFCLGGGLSPGDGIFRYKRSFATNGEKTFYIARRIHLPEFYKYIMNIWSEKYPELKKHYGHRLLAYRETGQL